MKFGGSMLTTHLRHFPNLNNRDQDWAQVFMYSKPYTKDTKVMYGRFSTNLLLKMFFFEWPNGIYMYMAVCQNQ